MNLEKYTVKSQEAIQKAVQIAQGMDNQVIEPGHLFRGILEVDDNVISFLFKKLRYYSRCFFASIFNYYC